ncbi:MAG TPA: NAD(P)H-hydrate dehydratase [Tepidisphaeraceae bacterium]|jgi:NAD(P)H-hydrate epimerase
MDRIAHPPQLPPRPADGHKGMFGRVLVVGGNEEMIGAPVLAGTSALKMGAGLVQIAVARSILAACLSITPELIGLGLRKGVNKVRLLNAAEKADAIVIGPGLGQSPEAAKRLNCLIRLDKPMVVDADALNLIAAMKKWPPSFKAHAVLTPHPGEMGRLVKLIGRSEVPTDEPGRIDIATEAARAFGQLIVLKGSRTIVTDGARLYINDTGDSSLSKAGTGDILSGIIGTLLSQKLNSFDAATLAVWLHGKAGEIAGKRLGNRCVLARDVIESIPAAIAARESDNLS